MIQQSTTNMTQLANLKRSLTLLQKSVKNAKTKEKKAVIIKRIIEKENQVNQLLQEHEREQKRNEQFQQQLEKKKLDEPNKEEITNIIKFAELTQQGRLMLRNDKLSFTITIGGLDVERIVNRLEGQNPEFRQLSSQMQESMLEHHITQLIEKDNENTNLVSFRGALLEDCRKNIREHFKQILHAIQNVQPLTVPITIGTLTAIISQVVKVKDPRTIDGYLDTFRQYHAIRQRDMHEEFDGFSPIPSQIRLKIDGFYEKLKEM